MPNREIFATFLNVSHLATLTFGKERPAFACIYVTTVLDAFSCFYVQVLFIRESFKKFSKSFCFMYFIIDCENPLQVMALIHKITGNVFSFVLILQKFRLEVGTQAMDTLVNILETDRSDAEITGYALDAFCNVMSNEPTDDGKRQQAFSRLMIDINTVSV